MVRKNVRKKLAQNETHRAPPHATPTELTCLGLITVDLSGACGIGSRGGLPEVGQAYLRHPSVVYESTRR